MIPRTSPALGSRLLVAMSLVGAAACTRPSENRAEAELAIGSAEIADASVRVAGGLAVVRELGDYVLDLRAQSPVLSIEFALGNTAAGDWTITVRNTPVDAVLDVGGLRVTREPDQHPTVGIFRVSLGAGTHTLRVAPPDADIVEPFKVAALADIQTAMPEVDEVFAKISAEPGLRFVVGMGDITERAEVSEYDLFERQVQSLTIPFYTTLGNHDLWTDYTRFHERFGRATFQFEFKGAAFTFADSGDAGIDPLVEEQLVTWLSAVRDRTSVFLTHFPPIDPLGVRYGGFRSAQDGRRLLARLAENEVDLTLYGHIHTFIDFENADIPAFISGGGGADPMKWDGIHRHFLVIDIDPARKRSYSVRVVRVD